LRKVVIASVSDAPVLEECDPWVVCV
jgi:hypothetical protein